MKNQLTVLLWFTCFYVCAQQNFHVTSQTADFPPDEVIVASPKLSIDDNYNLSLSWMEMNFSKAEGTIVKQSCNDFVAIECTFPKLYKDQTYLFSKKCDVKYELILRCLDNKVCVEINDFQVNFPKIGSSGGWEKVTISNKDLYKRNGEISLKKLETLTQLQDHFSEIIKGLDTYLNSPENRLLLADNK